MTHDPQPFARIAPAHMTGEPDASDIANTGTTFRRVFAPLAAVALVAAVLIAVLMVVA